MIKPVLSVVVCTYNRVELLKKCLTNLNNQSVNKDLYEVIIVDNNSTDDTRNFITNFITNKKNFRVALEKNQGLSHARNRGWHESFGDYIAFIDDDAYPTNDWCERILDAFENISPQPNAVGGTIYPEYEIFPENWFSDSLEIRSWGDNAIFLSKYRAKHGFSGSNMIIKRKILEKYNGFSTKFGLIKNKSILGEDTEFFFRLNSKDSILWYDPKIKVFHFTPRRNISMAFQVKRAFKNGETAAYIYNSNLFKILINKFFIFREKSDFILQSCSKSNCIKLVRIFLELFYWIGFMYVSIKILFRKGK